MKRTGCASAAIPFACNDEHAPGQSASARVHQHTAQKYALLLGLDERPGRVDKRGRRPIRIDVAHVLCPQVFAALVFGAQLCSARAASEDVITDAHTKSGSDQATVRMMSWPARFNATPRIGDAKDIVAVKIFVRNKEPFVMAIYNDPIKTALTVGCGFRA